MKKEVGHHINMASNACRVPKTLLIMLCIPSGYGMGHPDGMSWTLTLYKAKIHKMFCMTSNPGHEIELETQDTLHC
jgi:hypothetical protein